MTELSIVIPCYNEETYIYTCLNSIATQLETLTACVEVIIVNDGSTDSSSKIIDSFIAKYKNMKLIQTSHNGLAISRNIGIQCSSGNYIMFIDGDDWISDFCLNDILYLILNVNPDIIIGLIEGIPEEGVSKEYSDPINNLININECNENFLLNMHSAGLKIAPSVKYIFKKSLVVENDLLFMDLLHEDQLWSPLLLCYACSYKLYRKFFYKYRLKDTGLSSNNSLAVANAYLAICNELLKFVPEFVQNQKKNFIYERCFYLLEKIRIFSKSYTDEENILLKQLLIRYKHVTFLIEENTQKSIKIN